jgi:hypothetical protein
VGKSERHGPVTGRRGRRVTAGLSEQTARLDEAWLIDEALQGVEGKEGREQVGGKGRERRGRGERQWPQMPAVRRTWLQTSNQGLLTDLAHVLVAAKVG